MLSQESSTSVIIRCKAKWIGFWSFFSFVFSFKINFYWSIVAGWIASLTPKGSTYCFSPYLTFLSLIDILFGLFCHCLKLRISQTRPVIFPSWLPLQLSVVLQLFQACSPGVLMTSFIPFSSLLKFLSHVCIHPMLQPGTLQISVHQWILGSLIALSHLKNHTSWAFNVRHLLYSFWHLVLHTCRTLHVFLASPSWKWALRRWLAVFSAHHGAQHAVGNWIHIFGLECFQHRWHEEMGILYLLLKVVFILCRFHVDKLSSAHVYLRLHKVTGFKHGFKIFFFFFFFNFILFLNFT